jgi:hypothetical protein
MAPLSVDEHGIPRLMAATHAPVMVGHTATEVAIAHAQRLAPSWGARVPQLVGVGEVAMPGGTIVRLRQLLDGLPIDDGELHVFVRGDGGLVGVSGSMVDADAVRVAPKFIDDDAAAIARAIRANYKVAFDPHVLVPLKKRTDALRILTGRSGSIIVAAANATKVWSRAGNGLVAAWSIDVDSSTVKSTAGDGFHMVLAGADGHVLAHHSLVANDAFNYRVWADSAGEKHPFDGPTADPTPNVGGVNAPYPGFVVPNLVSVASLDHLNDPWLPAAATESSGNNVDAYTDVNAPDGFSAGDFRASTTAAGAFDRVYDLTAAPLSTSRWPRSRRCSTRPTGCTTSGTTTASSRRPATHSSTTTVAAASTAIRCTPKPRTMHSAPGSTTRTCRRRAMACRRACKSTFGAARKTSRSAIPATRRPSGSPRSVRRRSTRPRPRRSRTRPTAAPHSRRP